MPDNTETSPAHEGSSDINVSSDGGGYDIRTMMDISQTEEGRTYEDDGGMGEDIQDEGVEGDSNDPPYVEESDFDEESTSEESEIDREDGEEISEDDRAKENSIKFKDGDKEVSISKDAEVEIKIDGKKETMTLQEALSNASGNIHIGRETARLGRERKTFETERKEFNDEAMQVRANAEALLEIRDPYELCEYIAELKGGDADKLYQEMINSTVEHIKRYKDMTPREIQLERENRKYKREQKAREAREKVEKSTQEQAQKREQLESTLSEEGFTMDDFLKTVDELQEKAKNGEQLGFDLDSLENPTEDDIIDYMVAKSLEDRITKGVSEINEKLLEDTEFIEKAQKAILKTESLAGRMSQTEITEFLRKALELDNKALGENLSRKVKESQTKSKPVTSHEQEDGNIGDMTSIEELLERQRNV